MRSEKYNLFKIKFVIETLKSEEDKLIYLNELKNQLIEVINSFESRKVISIRNYGSDKHFLEDNSPELKSFVKKTINSYSHFQNDQRNPSDETIKELVKNEAQEYKKILLIIESEIEYYTKKSSDFEGQKLISSQELENLINSFESENSLLMDSHEDVLKKNKISSGLGPNAKIMWNGSEEELLKFIDNLVEDKILRFDSNEKRSSFLSEYFVNSDGIPFTFSDQVSESCEIVNFNWPKGAENLAE